MNQVRHSDFEKPEGMIQHECRTAIRDLIRVYGFEKAREMIAYFIIDELERSQYNG